MKSVGCSAFWDIPTPRPLTALGLHALQHRGQEAAGIVSFDGKRFHQERHMGLVGDHYTNPATLARLPGSMSIGHTRYSTTGEVAMRNVQPLFAELEEGGIAIAHNGNFTNGLTLRRQIIATGAICQSTSDTEVVLHLIARSRHSSTSDRFIDAIRQMEGGYSMLAMTRTKLIAARDPIGIRPLVMGELDGKPIFCSETCALDIIGAKFIRDVENGEVIICEIQPDGSVTVDARKPSKTQPERLCLFEYVYFARPDSVVGGRNVYTTRKNMGTNLAKESPVEGDVVVPVPDGWHAGGTRLRPAERHPVRIRHHPQPLCGPHLHRADPADPRLRREAEAFGEPCDDRGQARGFWWTTASCAAPPRSRSCR